MIGRPGVRGELNEKQHQEHDRQVEEAQDDAAQSHRVQRVGRAYGLTGIVSSGSTRLATSHHVLDLQVLPEDDEQHRHEQPR